MHPQGREDLKSWFFLKCHIIGQAGKKLGTLNLRGRAYQKYYGSKFEQLHSKAAAHTGKKAEDLNTGVRIKHSVWTAAEAAVQTLCFMRIEWLKFMNSVPARMIKRKKV